jgi:hypothetical protein
MPELRILFAGQKMDRNTRISRSLVRACQLRPRHAASAFPGEPQPLKSELTAPQTVDDEWFSRRNPYNPFHLLQS